MEFDFSPVDSLDKVPEQFRSLYVDKPGDDGKFTVNEQYNGVVEALVGLGRNVKELRTGLKNKNIDLSPLAEFGSNPKEIRENIINKIKELEEAANKNAGQEGAKIESVKQALAQAHAKEKEQLQTRTQALQNQLYTLMVENAATAAVVEAKGVPDLLLPFIKTQVKVVEEDGKFNVYVVDSAGEPRYGATGSPMTIKELVAEMKANEKFGRLFESEAPAGGGMNPGGGRQPAPRQTQPLSSTQKIAQGLSRGQYRRGA